MLIILYELLLIMCVSVQTFYNIFEKCPHERWDRCVVYLLNFTFIHSTLLFVIFTFDLLKKILFKLCIFHIKSSIKNIFSNIQFPFEWFVDCLSVEVKFELEGRSVLKVLERVVELPALGFRIQRVRAGVELRALLWVR